ACAAPLAAAGRARAQSPASPTVAAFAVSDSVLRLDPFVRSVLQRNPSYAAMRAAAREADAATDREGALADPMVELGLAPRSLGASDVDPGWRASISEPLPLFGQRGLRRRAAAAAAGVARGDAETARL